MPRTKSLMIPMLTGISLFLGGCIFEEKKSDLQVDKVKVKGLSALYDTTRMTARLTWKPVAYEDFKEYLVFRRETSNLVLPTVPIAALKDTVLVDSLAAFAADSASIRLTFEYHVLVRNLSNQDGLPNGSVLVTAAPRKLVKTVFTLGSPDRPLLRASVGDTLRLTARWDNPTRAQDSLEWAAEGGSPSKRSLRVSGKSGSDTFPFVLPRAPGTVRIQVRMKDAAGDAWTDSMSIRVEEDRPVADAGKDTLVAVLDKVRLRGKAVQEFGRIVKWEWDIGNRGEFVEVNGSDTVIRASGVATATSHVLRVTDDDGSVGLDTVNVQVILDLPVADAGRDTSHHVEDSLSLRGKASSRFGKITKWEWDIGGTGTFRETTSGDSTFKLIGPPRLLPCILRVTDDKNRFALDTVVYRFHASRVSMIHEDMYEAEDLLVAQGRIFVTAGLSFSGGTRSRSPESDYWNFDPSTRKWAPHQGPRAMRMAFGCSFAEGDDIYAFGNVTMHDTVYFHYNSLNARTTTTLEKYSVKRAYGMGCTNMNGKFFVFGGDLAPYYLNDFRNAPKGAWVYDIAAMTWAVVTPMPFASGIHLTSENLGGKVYVASAGYFYANGERGKKIATDLLPEDMLRFQEYDPTTKTWSQRKPLPALLENLRLAALNGKIYAVGTDPDSIGDRVFIYDQSLDQWSETYPMFHKNGNGVVGLNGSLYMLGPMVPDSEGNDRYVFEQYTPQP